MPRNPEVNFYLKPVDATGKSLIFLNFKYNRNRLFFSFGERIRPEDWNANKQRAKRKGELAADGDHSLNDLLDSLKTVCEKAYITEKAKGIPTPEVLRHHLQNFLNQNQGDDREDDKPTLFKLIDRFINNEIKHKGKKKSENTIKAYRGVKKSLTDFEHYMQQQVGGKGYKLDFNSIDLNFFYKYVHYLSTRTEVNGKKVEKIESQNTLAKYVQTIKVFMGEAVDLELTTNLQFKHRKFVVDRVDTDAVYLTESELNNLYKFDFSNNKRLEQVRDLFVFGSWVGLRFSDYSNVKPENIVQIDGEYFIKIITQKTKELVIIPCNPVVLDIFKRYEHNRNKLPNAISNQKFNEYVKEVCKLAGLTEKGRLSTHPELELWECISSHSARRSFSTNYFLQGFPI